VFKHLKFDYWIYGCIKSTRRYVIMELS